MSDLQMWYCSIGTGVPYAAVKITSPTWPTAVWGRGRTLRHASCTVRSESMPTYERFTIEMEDFTGVQLPGLVPTRIVRDDIHK